MNHRDGGVPGMKIFKLPSGRSPIPSAVLLRGWLRSAFLRRFLLLVSRHSRPLRRWSLSPEECCAAQSIQMVKIIPDRSYQRLDAFWLYPADSKIAFDPELLNLPGPIPNQPPRDRRCIHMKCGNVGGFPPTVLRHILLEAAANEVILPRQPPDRFAAEASMLVEGVERYVSDDK